MTPEEQIDAITLSVVEQFATDMVAGIKADLSIPYPPASKPGEKPHRRTGDLRSHVIVSEISQRGPITTLSITSMMFYSFFLENGTSRMAPRPFMEPEQNKWTPILIARLQAAFTPPPFFAAFAALFENPPLAA